MPKQHLDKNMIKLQSILLPSNLCCEEQVYYHISEDGRVQDFDGYFNLFYIEKRKRYTSIDKFYVLLRLKGYSSISLMHDRDVINTIQIQEFDIETESIYEFPYDRYNDGVFWIRLERAISHRDTFVSGYYIGRTLEKIKAKVFVNICTYKREEYVVKNMKRLSSFLDNPENQEISNNLQVAIIDNGQTLDKCCELQNILNNHPQIAVIRNSNTGGAGGFTRGMEEAISRKDKENLTHVLLMDDDALFHTDLFIRLFGVLKTLRHEFKDLTIGGALWRHDYPFIQHAAGEWYEKLKESNEIQSLDMRQYDNCMQKEMCTTSNELHRYSGWWCCCYSLNIVKTDNLPIKQFFIHMDDIEYEKRNRFNGNPVAFFNGIGVWHKAFDTEFLGIKTYYNTRNSLILCSKLEPEVSCHSIKMKLCRMLIGNCLDNRYLKMHLMFTGISDFVKGNRWFETVNSEQNHKNIAKYVKKVQEKYMVTDLDDSRIASVKDKIVEFQSKLMPLTDVLSVGKEGQIHLPLYKKISLNGKLLPQKKSIAVIYPYDRLWKKGYRQGRYAFVQSDPDKVFYVEKSFLEILSLIHMLIFVCVRLNKSVFKSYR